MTQRTQRGMGMIDALIALAILAFGLLALTRFQGRMTSQSTDAMARQNANRLADELVSMAVLDPAGWACYTVPATGTCTNAAARALTTNWMTRVSTGVPGYSAATVTALAEAAGTRITIQINWTGKDQDADARQLVTVTHVR